MNKYSLYRISLNISIALSLIGLLFKVMHWPGGSVLMSTAYILSIVYVVIGLIELYHDKKKGILEMGAWLIGFLIITPITGILFYFMEFKRK